MKPTLSQLEKRVRALEPAPERAPLEPVRLRVVYVDPQGKEIAPPTEWTTTRDRNPGTGREIIVEWPVYSGAALT